VSVAVHDYSMVVGGAWAESESGGRTEATSPGTGASLGTVPEGTRTDAARAIAAANRAWREWAAKTAFERAAAMDRRGRISHGPLLAGDGPHGSDRGHGGRARGDVRAGRSRHAYLE